MGTWGSVIFEDDTALEKYDDFCSGDQSPEEFDSIFDKVLDTPYTLEGEYLMDGFTEPVKALVYAEIIAAALGNKSDKFPDEEYHQDMELPAIDLEKIKQAITPALTNKAISVIEKIRDTKGIHLTELWMESESYQEWSDYLSALIGRLR